MTPSDIKKIPPTPIYEFRGAETSQVLHIPEIAQNRKCTDVPFLIFAILSILATFILTITIIDSGTDFKRFIYGYDKCGDTCGSENEPIAGIDCSGKDLSDKSLMKYTLLLRKNGSQKTLLPDMCVSMCDPGYRALFHRCFPPGITPKTKRANQTLTFLVFFDDLKTSIVPVMVPMWCIGLILTVAILACFILWTQTMICIIFLLSLIVTISLCIYIWILYSDNTQYVSLLVIAIFITIGTVLLLLMMCAFYERYPLLIEIFREATAAAVKYPLLIVFPFFTILTIVFIAACTAFLTITLSTHQSLVKVESNPLVYDYEIKVLPIVGICFLLFICFWMLFFINGAQCFIIAGPVSAYYFQRQYANYKIAQSIYTLVRFHLGTIVFGSFCLAVMFVVRILLTALEQRSETKELAICLKASCACCQDMMEYLARRAYIQTAMHGKSLYQSGKRAARLLWTNLLDTLTIDMVASFFMFCTCISVIVTCAAVGKLIHYLGCMIFGERLFVIISVYSLPNASPCMSWIQLELGKWIFQLKIEHFWSVVLVGASGVAIIVYYFLQIISISVETIYLCYCEDKMLNNGQDRPYFMSARMKAIVEKLEELNKKLQNSDQNTA